MSDSRPSVIPSVDGLRGLAALYVVMFHLFNGVLAAGPAASILAYGYGAVPVFFVVSGFLLFRSLSALAQRQPDWRSAFYMKRFFRIIPLWWLLCLSCGLYFRWPLSVLAANLTFAFGFLLHDPSYLPIAPAWSLFVEEVFYLALPWVFPSCRSPVRVALLALSTYLLAQFWFTFALPMGVPAGNQFISRAPFASLHFFFIGGLMSHAYDHPRARAWLSGAGARDWKAWKIALDLIAISAFLAPAFNIRVPVELGCSFVVIVALLPGTLASILASARALRWVGVRCYFIYLAHLPLARALGPVWYEVIPPGPAQNVLAYSLFKLAFILGVTLALAKLSWDWLEEPCIRLARSWGARKVAR